MQNVHREMQNVRSDRGMRAAPRLLSADQVRRLLQIDRSTVYRMAESGRLPAMKIGRQWRFAENEVERLLEPSNRDQDRTGTADDREQLLRALRAALPLIELAAQLLGVMMIVTDMSGQPLTEIVNPCQWFGERADDPDLLSSCLVDWRQIADDSDLNTRFHTGPLRVDCAHTFIRLDSRLIGMLIAGGVAVDDDDSRALYRLSAEGRARVLSCLPIVAARVARVAAGSTGTREMA